MCMEENLSSLRMLFIVSLPVLTTMLFLGRWQQRRGPGLDYFYFSASSHRSLLRAPGHSALLMHYQ